MHKSLCGCERCDLKRVVFAFGLLGILCAIGMAQGCTSLEVSYTKNGVFRERYGCVHYQPDGNVGDTYATVLVVGENEDGTKWVVNFTESDKREPDEVEKGTVHFFGCPGTLNIVIGERL